MRISKQEQLLEIKDSVKELTENLADLQLHLRQLELQIASEPPSDTFVVGDIIEITNNCQGFKGTHGKVIYTTAKQCTIRDFSRKRTQKNVLTSY